MTKSQIAIVGISITIIIGVLLFPFYWKGEFGPDKKLIRIRLVWDFDPNLSDMLKPSEGIKQGEYSGNGVILFSHLGMMGHPVRRDIQGFMILGIIILMTGGLVAKKKSYQGERGGMKRVNKLITLSLAFMITLFILIPPCNMFVLASKNNQITKVGTRWAFILQTKSRDLSGAYMLSGLDAEFLEIRYPVLVAQVAGLLCLVGVSCLVARRRKSGS
jgi:hypothetical protein